jgi:Na+-translocating ferredoxin:NAD+ oxidoreductase subunit C
VATAVAVAEAVRRGTPLVERVVTVSGDAIGRPANLAARIGTPLQALINACGGLTEKSVKVIVGGPMMGFAVSSLDIPVVKSTTAVLAFSRRTALKGMGASTCFRCGRCAESCPMGLQPGTISLLAEKERYDDARQNYLLECLECGCCAYVCPAKRPIVQAIQRAKSRLADNK